jgi:hypothetical protein
LIDEVEHPLPIDDKVAPHRQAPRLDDEVFKAVNQVQYLHEGDLG